jgi:transcription elongation factor GreA
MTFDTSEQATPAQRVLALAEDKQTQHVEDAWLELVESPPREGAFYEKFVKMMRRAKALDQARSLVVLLLDEVQGRSDWELLHTTVCSIAATWPDDPQIRPFAAKALKGLHADNPQLTQMLAGCKGLPLDKALERFQTYVRFMPGEAYSHAYMGQGMVTAVDVAGGQVTLDFREEKGKTLALDFAIKHLTWLPPGHVLGERVRNPARLAALAEENPLEVVRMALNSTGGRVKQAELKAMLLGDIIAEESWPAWWGRARAELRVDPMIDFDARRGAHAEIVMRDHPRTFEEEIEDLFFATGATLTEQVAAVQNLRRAIDAAKTREAGSADTEPERRTLILRMIDHLGNRVKQLAAVPEDRVKAVESAFLIDDIRALLPGAENPSGVPNAGNLLLDFDDYDPLSGFENPDYGARALKLLMARDGVNGIERAADMLPWAPVKLAQAIWTELDSDHHLELAVKSVQRLLAQPLENPATYLWAIRAIIEGGWGHLDEYFPRTYLVPDLVESLDTWEQIAERTSTDKETAAAARLLLSKVRSLLQGRQFGAICESAAALPLDEAKRMRRNLLNSSALNESYKSAADRQLVLACPALEEPAVAETGASAEPSFHFCTVRGQAVKSRELEHLTLVRIPRNAVEIEKARSEGDLKENAGYHAARERHVLLLQEAHELGQALATARLFDKAKVTGKEIGFGVSFEAENTGTGSRENFTCLGRFETDPPRGILSYQSPFMQQFNGKKAGDEVTVDFGGNRITYRIVSIANALAGGQWDQEPEQE